MEKFIAVFRVTKNVSHAFQEWMETHHFPKMENTRCFTFKHDKIINTSEELDVIVYIHESLNWVEYNENPLFRKVLKAEFESNWGSEINKTIFPLILINGEFTNL